jgi:hypothetical protein
MMTTVVGPHLTDEGPVRQCPVCGSTTFGDYRKRRYVRCTGCGSMERTRFMYIALRDLVPLPNGLPVVHFAPEVAISELLISRYPNTYRPADFAPSQYAWLKQPMQQVDLSRPLDFFAPNSVQGFVHAHVLEHVPGDLHRIIKQMNMALVPGGFHAFCIPFFSEWYREDMNIAMPHAERDRLFGQHDHVRSFGTRDTEERLLSLFDDFERIEMNKLYSSEQLAASAIPPQAIMALTSHTVFYFVKRR